jgi:hypothetical protein
MLSSFDAGLLNEYSTVSDWQDYIRSLLDSAHEHYEEAYNQMLDEKDSRITELEEAEANEEDNSRIGELEGEIDNMEGEIEDLKKALSRIQEITNDHI